jgi:hypothetical protein
MTTWITLILSFPFLALIEGNIQIGAEDGSNGEFLVICFSV